MSRYRRDRTPENSADEPRARFFTIIRNASIERRIGEQVYTLFENVREKYSMDGDPLEWLIPGVYAVAVSQRVHGECNIQMSVLLKAITLSIPQFYSRLRKWIEISPIPSATREIFSQSERYFQVSRNVFERYEQMFLSVFHDPVDPEMPRSSAIEKSVTARKKKPAQPKYVQPIDLYIFTWDLFIRIRRVAAAIRDDLVSSYHLLICVVDLVFQNVLPLKRRDLLNEQSTVIPAELTAETSQPENAKIFSLIPYLCAHFEGIYKDCKTLYIKAFVPIVEGLIDLKELIADKATIRGMLAPADYEQNLLNINNSYEDLIRTCCAVDERILLVSVDISNPAISGDPLHPIDVYDMLRDRRKLNPVSTRKLEFVDFITPRPVQPPAAMSSPTPLTPTSSCTALERREAQESAKTPALSTAVDLVTKLSAMCTGRTNVPSSNLTSMLTSLYGKDVSSDFIKLSAACRELMVSAYLDQCDPTRMAEPFIRQRFVFAETWFFRLLEDVLVSERTRGPSNTPRTKKLVDSEKFQKALFGFAIEMVLFSYNCSRMFPWPLEVLRIDPYDFVKIIEPVVHLVPLPSSLVRHLSRIEESILEQIVWKSESPLWKEISDEEILPVRDVCWPHNLEECPTVETNNQGLPEAIVLSPMPSTSTGRGRRSNIAVQQSLVPITNTTGSEQRFIINPQPHTQPTSNSKPARTSAVCLFFRKVYVLAAARLREICNQLSFTAEVERDYHVFQRMFTLFEHTLTRHTDLLKDRHLDQILLCCAYVVAKLEAANGLDKSFHQIMHAYRFQPQAESRVYRSVLIGPKPVTVSHPHDTRRRAQALSQAGPDGDGDEIRADIISFYNTVFVRAMQSFIARFSPKKKGGGPSVALSPVPRVSSNSGGRRQVHPSGNVFISPLKKELLPPLLPHDGRVLTFTFGVSGQQQESLLAAANSIPFPMPHRVPKYPLKRTDTSTPDSEPKRIKLEPATIMAAVAASCASPTKTTSSLTPVPPSAASSTISVTAVTGAAPATVTSLAAAIDTSPVPPAETTRENSVSNSDSLLSVESGSVASLPLTNGEKMTADDISIASL